MSLQENFESTGAWLFRWRSYLPLFMVAGFLAALIDFEYLGGSEELDHLWEALCLTVSFLGLGVRVLTVGCTPRGTSGRNTREQVADSLNTTGVYSVVRNPLYLGNFFMGLGPALFPHIWWVAVLYALVFWLYYERIIFAEEGFLKGEFGEEFTDWASKTPAFLPRFRSYVTSDLPFSLRNVLRREYNGLFGVILVFFAEEVVGDWFYLGRVEVDLGWAVLLGLGFATWTILRALKKHTSLLDVAGR